MNERTNWSRLVATAETQSRLRSNLRAPKEAENGGVGGRRGRAQADPPDPPGSIRDLERSLAFWSQVPRGWGWGMGVGDGDGLEWQTLRINTHGIFDL